MSFDIETIFKYSENEMNNFLSGEGINIKSYPDIKQKRYLTIYVLDNKNLMVKDEYLNNPNLMDYILQSHTWDEFKNYIKPKIYSSLKSMSKITKAPSSKSIIIPGSTLDYIVIDNDKYTTTKELFSTLNDKYKYYKWVTPQNDKNLAGFFIFIYDDGKDVSKNVNITANKTMLGNIQNTTKKDYEETENEEGTTTFIIDAIKIPLGSKFKWNNKGYWVYSNYYSNSYYKIDLKIDNFMYTFNSLIEDKIYDDKLTEFRLVEKANNDALNAAMLLKQSLVEHNLNVVTAESLTAGMLAKILVDIPSNGAAVYGGFVVYDTDAKRRFLDVKTEGVYSHATAEQMAYGALKKSRAMVSIAVTGNAMPYPEDADHMGDVYIAVGFRVPDNEGNEFTIVSEHFNFCDKIGKLCGDWKFLHSRKNKDDQYKVYAPMQMTSFIADFVRLSTVKEACLMGVKYINLLDADKHMTNLKTVPYEPWDKICSPSNILKKHINPGSNSIAQNWCNDYEQNNINFI